MNKEKGLQENILSSLRKNKMSCEAVSAKEKWKIQQTWRERFAEGVKSKTGKWVFKNSACAVQELKKRSNKSWLIGFFLLHRIIIFPHIFAVKKGD
jgi:hypothetical protein